MFRLPLFADGLSPPVNVTITAVKANSAVVTWDIPEGDPVIGFAITQQVSNLTRVHINGISSRPAALGLRKGIRARTHARC